MNLKINKLNFLRYTHRIILIFCLFSISSYQVYSQVVDTIVMSVEPFEGDDNVVSKYTREQIGEILSSQLTDYIIPVLNIDERSKVVLLRTEYKQKSTISDTLAPVSRYPTYVCRGKISREFITANITKFQNEETLLRVEIERKKNAQHIQKDVRNLSDNIIEKFIEQIYGVSLGQDSRMIVRMNSKDNLEIIQPEHLMKNRKKIVELNGGAKVLNIKASTASGRSKEEVLKLRSKALQFASIKQHKKTIKIKRLKNKLELSPMLFLNDNYLSQLYELGIKREVGGNFSLGIGIGIGMLSYEHSLSTFNDLEPIVTEEEKEFKNLALLLDYEHFFSKSDIIISPELGISPFLKGGHFQTSISWASLHWLSFEVGIRSYAIDIDRYQFEVFQSEADKITQEERFTFLTLGLRLKYNF